MTDTISILGGIASIIALLFTLVVFFNKQYSKIKEAKEQAERELNELLSQYENAGKTVGARSDLGTFFVNKLSMIRSNVLHVCIAKWGYVVVCFVFLTGSLVSIESNPVTYVLLFLGLCSFIVSRIRSKTESDWIELENKYDEHMNRIWETPINKRLNHSD